MATNEMCPIGFTEGPAGWGLSGSTFLGPMGSGSFRTLGEAMVWAKLLGGQCGGIQYNPRYGYMLRHSSKFWMDTKLEVVQSWSKGEEHVMEPAYPYQLRGYTKFIIECETARQNGYEFSPEFNAMFLQEAWRRYTKKDFHSDIDEIYERESQPGWFERAKYHGAEWLSALPTLRETINQVLDVVGTETSVHRDDGWMKTMNPLFDLGDIGGGDGVLLERAEALSSECCPGCADLDAGTGGENQMCHMGSTGCLGDWEHL